MNLFKLSLRMLRRDWRAGELRVLAFALVIAVGGMTTVGFFADRVQLALSRQGNQLLGADLIIFSDHALPPHYAAEAKRRGLNISTALKFPSMVAKGDNSLLTEIKAVTEGYPLRGDLRISEHFGDASAQTAQAAHSIPASGSAWVDEKLMVRLELKRGEMIEVGAATLTVAALITQEPDYSIGFINLRPRLLINAADLPATGLVQQGSRISYRLLVAGESGAVERFRSWAQSRLMLGERIEGIRDARPEIKAALERAEKFLSLAALASVVLAAAAAALAVRRFTQRHLDGCAVMRCLGASQSAMLRLYLYHFLTLGLIASGIGCLLGFIAQQMLTFWLSGWVEAELPWPSIWPAIHGLLSGMVLLLGFALPPLLNLRSVPALRVLRRDIGLPNSYSITGYVLGLAALSALFLWKAGDIRLGASVIGGFTAAIAVFGLIGFVLVNALTHMRSRTGGPWRYGLASIRRRATASVVQAVALGLGLMALLALTLIRDDLLQNWRTSLPPDAPNHFLVNIQKDQLQPLAEFFIRHKLAQPPIFPMVRGRLTAINDKPIASEDFVDIRAKRLVEREFNLSWADKMQSDNQIVKGRWWKEGDSGKAILSMEEDIAKTVGINIGDVLTYDIAGSTFSAEVTSLRKVNWDSFRVNFFVVTPPGVLENYPASYITSFHLPPGSLDLTNQLIKAFPNLLVIDVASIITQVQKMIEQVTQAVEFVFLFTLLAGLAVLYAAIVSTQDERIHEAAIFRTLGAKRGQLARAWAAEFAILGGLAGLFAAAGATALGYVVGEYALNLTYTFNPWIWLTGLAGGVVGVTVAGLMGTRSALSTPPLLTLRNI
ncbi:MULTISPECIES: ABC transporter permease [unclassified Nitrosospira]|uniref:ABC transporter permease n=1 Tax=unclassified Nitrosospira TaxID=2609267 RepID=UPI000D2F7BF5|nr:MULTISPECIES: FtsX-like permease family protein [unclassified Nitrosospira]PTR14761.1 putative ABC transport system permease protein [Nitrosospira sp. Nsp2]WON73184.1 FtsX-like permease family protein [Nitrosospira sp. Is2]